MAETCPSVSEIKNNALTKGWRVYDIDDNTLIPSSRVAELAKHIDQFALAEWSDKKPGTVHCYYRDKHGSNLEAYFSKDNFKPINTANVWYEVSGYMHCAAGYEKCSFQSNLTADPQFAKR